MTLRVETFSILRGGRRIIADLSFQISPGEAVLLRGPNGVGKSTLLRGLCGLLPVQHGEASLGASTLRDRDAWVSQIVYAGHADALKPQLTVEENIRFWAGLFGGDPETAMETFRLVEIADRPVFACSAGQKRRTGLARLALAQDRPLWLLDEPTVSLDAETVDLVANVIGQHLTQGGMALIATHIELGLAGRVLTLTKPDPQADPSESDPFLAEDFA
jgi:heme exporter protein A